MTIKSAKHWGSTRGPSKSSESFSVTLTVPFQLEVDALTASEARQKVATLPMVDVERTAIEKGKVKCPTLGEGTIDIKRTILAVEKVEQGG